MADPVNPFDFAGEDLVTFLAKVVSDGTYADIVEALKVDAAGQAVPASRIVEAIGQLYGNTMDDFLLAAYPLLRQVATGGAGGWSLGDSTTINMGVNGALYLFDDDLTDSHNSNTMVVQTGSAEYIEHMGKTFLKIDGQNFKAPHDATLDALGDLTISFVVVMRGKPFGATQGVFGYGDFALSAADANFNLNYYFQMIGNAWQYFHEHTLGVNVSQSMVDPSVSEIGMTLGMIHMTRKANTGAGGELTMYYNANVAQGPDPFTSNADTGGAPAQELWLGSTAAGTQNARLWIADLKINPGALLTQSQITAEYEQVFG